MKAILQNNILVEPETKSKVLTHSDEDDQSPQVCVVKAPLPTGMRMPGISGVGWVTVPISEKITVGARIICAFVRVLDIPGIEDKIYFVKEPDILGVL